MSVPSPAARAGAPKIDFDARVHDFGLVNEGTWIEHVFRVRNLGAAPLELSDVHTSCGCTAATLGASTVLPGQSTSFAVRMDTRGERGPGMRDIGLSSNDPRETTSTLRITYDVERLLDLGGPFVSLRAAPGKRRTERLWLGGQLAGSAKLRIARVEGGALLGARCIEVREGAQLRKGVQLSLKSKSPVSGEAVITLQTGLSNPSELSLRVGYVVD